MALRKYRNLELFREAINQVVPINFPTANFYPGDVQWRGADTNCPLLKFSSGILNGVECKIHNYMMYVIFPEGFNDEYSFFQKEFNFKISELNIWVKSEGNHLRVYPWDRNNYNDTELDHKKRAVYFISCLYVVLKWIQREIDKRLTEV